MKWIVPLVLTAALMSCGTSKINQAGMEEPDFTPQYTPGPHALVYKTRQDYRNLVPVLLSDDKTQVVAYPHPSDLVQGNAFPLPTQLNGNYLLDNRGIGANVAFLRLTYAAYTSLQQPPSPEMLYGLIKDKDPLTEMYDCGNKKAFKNITAQLNRLISSNALHTTCKRIK